MIPTAARDVEPGASWAFTDHATVEAHHPLGASGAERWMNCPGSIELVKLIAGGDGDNEFSGPGTAAHELGAGCLRDHTDAWEWVGGVYNKEYTITADDAVAVQVYLDCVRGRIALLSEVCEVKEYIEYHITVGSGFGTADHCLIAGDLAEITDYKHGVGVWVDVVDNAQLKYYAWGFVKDRPEVKRIKLRIVQPRCPVGKPVREWEISREELQSWVENELLPAMARTEIDTSVTPGAWCRFCPARIVCPAMHGLVEAAATANTASAAVMSDAQLVRAWALIEPARIGIKAIDGEMFSRLNAGKDFGANGPHLTYGKSDRIWHDGAEAAFRERFGNEALTPQVLKSPAQMEKLPGAATLVKEHAYSPQGKLTVVSGSDKRPAINPSAKAVGLLQKHLTSAA